jgi:hypothetical protein
MFDDPAIEIQELTAVIKQDITALNGSIEELQKVCESRDGASRNKHTSDYSTTVVDSLKNRLMSATKSFKDVLTLRTEVPGHCAFPHVTFFVFLFLNALFGTCRASKFMKIADSFLHLLTMSEVAV